MRVHPQHTSPRPSLLSSSYDSNTRTPTPPRTRTAPYINPHRRNALTTTRPRCSLALPNSLSNARPSARALSHQFSDGTAVTERPVDHAKSPTAHTHAIHANRRARPLLLFRLLALTRPYLLRPESQCLHQTSREHPLPPPHSLSLDLTLTPALTLPASPIVPSSLSASLPPSSFQSLAPSAWREAAGTDLEAAAGSPQPTLRAPAAAIPSASTGKHRRKTPRLLSEAGSMSQWGAALRL
jgi:hypothetical protein